ncbi:MAG: response regulator [Smithellaceae bacterium]
MKTKVLVVDDNSDNLYLLTTILEGQGWEVREAQNGKVALEMAKDQAPDLIVSDILMPVMDGYTLCRHCKSDEKLKNIPFVFYTATYTEPKDEKFALDLGADRFILKPENPSALIKILIDLLEEKKLAPGTAKPLGEEMEFFRRYNEILFGKLEKKMSDLEAANQELRTLGENYRLSIENVSDVIFMLDTDLKILSVSPGVEKALGYSPQDFIGRSIADVGPILTPQSLEQGINHVSRICKGETMSPSVYEFIAKDGTIKIGEVSGSPIMRDGKITGIIAVARDITNRRQAEEALRESEYRVKSISDSLPDGMIYQIIAKADGTRQFTYLSESVRKMYGISPEEGMADSALIFARMYEDDREIIKKAEDEAIKNMSTFRMEVRVREPSGGIRWSEFSSSPTLMKDGSTCWNGIELVVTKRRQVEEAMKKSEENFRNSMNNSIMGVRIVSDDGMTLYANQATLDLYGFADIDELKNTPVTKCYTKESLAENKQRREERKRNGIGPLNYVISIIRKDGEIRHLEVFRREILWDGVKRFQVLYNDITDRRRAEEALRERDILFNKLSLNVPGMIFQFMKRPDGTYCLPFSSNAIKDLFGCSPEDVLDDFSPIARVVFPEDMNKINDSIELSAKQMTVWQCEYRVQLPGQPIKWVFGQSTPEKLADGSIVWHGYDTDITERKLAEEYLRLTLENVNKAVSTTIHVLAAAVEVRDPYTAGHQTRAADLARAIAEEMGLPREKIDGIMMAGSIHDIGKLSVPAEILTKSSKLSNIEFALIKEHAEKGHEMLKDVESPWPLSEMVYQHHERMDGSGYPRNLKDDEILMEARILAVADVVEAMASHRPYRPSLGLPAALEEIEKNKGILYDNDVADACLKLFREKGYHMPEVSAHN